MAVSEKGPSALANAAIRFNLLVRGFSKVGATGCCFNSYNVVVLGAALIAHELGLVKLLA